MSFVAAGVSLAGLAGGLISSNQSRQDAKHGQSLTDQAVNTSNDQYNSKAPLRAQSLAMLANAKRPDLSSIYRTQADPLGAQAEAAQGRTLASLTDSPSIDDQVRQKLANFDAAGAPVLAAQRRSTGQSAASLGRIGSGGVTTTLGNLESDYERNRGITESDAIAQAIKDAQANKFNILNASGSIAGQRQGVQQQGVQNRAAQYGAEQGAQAQNFGQGVSLANLGFSNTPASTDLSGAANYNNAAANDAAGAGAAFGQFGKSLAQLTAPKKAATFGTNASNADGQDKA